MADIDERAELAFEPIEEPGIVPPEQLERDQLIPCTVVAFVDGAEPTTAQQSMYGKSSRPSEFFVRGLDRADVLKSFALRRESWRVRPSEVDRRMVDQAVSFIVGSQERLGFGPLRGVSGARLVQVISARSLPAPQGAVEHGLDVLPLLGHHSRAFLISRCSHALATFRSRLTVAGDTPIEFAVCSIVSPPKKRSSTIRLC